jgi:hypothetical protein
MSYSCYFVIERMSADIIVFLDADIRNLTTDWANQLVAAIIDDNCDMSRDFILGMLEIRQ